MVYGYFLFLVFLTIINNTAIKHSGTHLLMPKSLSIKSVEFMAPFFNSE